MSVEFILVWAWVIKSFLGLFLFLSFHIILFPFRFVSSCPFIVTKRVCLERLRRAAEYIYTFVYKNIYKIYSISCFKV